MSIAETPSLIIGKCRLADRPVVAYLASHPVAAAGTIGDKPGLFMNSPG
ncbi:MAG: hypothetical protein IIA07_04905 [Proteobacteria bacterium]|nr:hypothetical protein [Pseudomonadota bacterium]